MNNQTSDTKETICENTIQTDADTANRDRIKKEDKKAIIPFLLFCVIGGVIGYLAADLFLTFKDGPSGEALLLNFHDSQLSFRVFSGYACFIISVVLSLVGFILLAQCKKAHKKADLDNEKVLYGLEMKLSVVLIIASVTTILAWLLYGTGFYGVTFSANVKIELLPLILCLVGFIFMSVCTTILQQKVVNLEKQLNPEKKGSVFDMKFQKKWMNSCDEAEQFFIYKCCFKSYMATQTTCVVMEVILVFLGMMLPIGITPIICVTIIWAVSSIVYMIEAMKLPKPPTNEEV